MSDLLRGLRFFERLRVVHFDMKPANILISSSLRLKIGDFGLMKSLDDKYAGPRGTYRFCSPELFAAEFGDFKADVFATGIVLYELLTLHHPFITAYDEQHNPNLQSNHDATNRRAWREVIISHPLIHLRPHICTIDPAVTALIEEMLIKRHSDRPLASKILSSHFLINNVPELYQREQFAKQAAAEERMAHLAEENEVSTLFF